ncbi:MAG: tail fiber domain-containing protein [Bacteroidia bacterium]|nr:tail fiber domain-containing protein [Bacteroidia bacterium]
MKRIKITVIFVLLSILLIAQSPYALNYQAVVRGSDGNIVKNSTVQFQFSILQGSSTGTAVYVETHSVITNSYGLVNLVIGDGAIVSGDILNVSWEKNSHFLKVDLDVTGASSFVHMSTQQLVAVPYALHAQTVTHSDNDSTNELQTISISGTDLSLSDGGGTVSIDDNDADPNNEIQTISKAGNTVTLSNSGGSYTDAVDDADASATNEIQTISKSGNTVSLSISGGSVSIDDADASATNEIQTISKSGNTVTLSNSGGSYADEVFDGDSSNTNEIQTISKSGSTVTLSNSGGSYTDAVDDADASTTNEIQTISKSGNTVTLSNSGGSFTDAVDDADASTSNELQTISKSGNTVTLSNSGGSYTDEVFDGDSSTTNELQTLSLSGDSIGLSLSSNKIAIGQFGHWNKNGSSLYIDSALNVGIGTTSPSSLHKLHIYSADSVNNGIYLYNNVDVATGSAYNASFTLDRKSTGQGNVYGLASGAHFKPETSGNYSTYGLYNTVTSEPDDISGQKTYGIFNNVTRRDSGYGITYGLYNYVRNYGNDGPVTGNFLYTTSSSPDDLIGAYDYVLKDAGQIGETKGSYLYVSASPATGADKVYGQHTNIVSAPDAASSSEVSGLFMEVQRSDSGSGVTKGMHLDLNHTGKYGDVYGTHIDLELTGASSGTAYGQNTSVAKQGNGLLFGNRVFVNRSSGYAGKTYGTYVQVGTQNPVATSSLFNTYGQYLDISSSPASSAWTLGTYMKLDRTGSGTGSTVLRYDDLTHDSSGYVYGNYMNITRSSQSNTDLTYGSYNVIDITNGGTAYGENTSITLGNSSSSTAGNVTGNLAVAYRNGTGNYSSYGLYGGSYNYATGTGSKYSYGVYGSANANNTIGNMFTYGLYGYATGGDFNYAGYFTGNVYTTGSYLPSDSKLKSNIKESNSSLDQLLSLQVYNYQYNQNLFGGMNLPVGQQTGFLADEVSNIFPELTMVTHQPALPDRILEKMRENGKPIADYQENGQTFKAVNYAGLVPHLTKAIQEQQSIIEIQQTENQAQNIKIEALKKQIFELKSIIDSIQKSIEQ